MEQLDDNIETDIIHLIPFREKDIIRHSSDCIITTPAVTPTLRDIHRTEPDTLKRLCQFKILEQTHCVIVTKRMGEGYFMEKPVPNTEMYATKQQHLDCL